VIAGGRLKVYRRGQSFQRRIVQAIPRHFARSIKDCKTLVVLTKIVDTVTKAGDAIPIFEENLGPRVQGIFDRTVLIGLAGTWQYGR